MNHISPFNYFLLENSHYKDYEYIDIKILRDVLNDIVDDTHLSISLNKNIDYDDYDIPIEYISGGKNGYLKDIDKFGVYRLTIIGDVENKMDYILNMVEKSIEYYYSCTGDKIISFYGKKFRGISTCIYPVILTSSNTNGMEKYVKLYFSRSDILKYISPSFNKHYEII